MDSQDYRTDDRPRNRTTADASESQSSRPQRTSSRPSSRPTPRPTTRSASRASSRPARTDQERQGARPRSTDRPSQRPYERSARPRSRQGTTRIVSSSSQTGGGGIFSGSGSSPASKVMDLLPDNVWVRRGILVVAALLVVFILFNLVTCIGGAVAPKPDAQQSGNSAASAESSQASASASAAATTQGVASPWTDNGTFSTGDSALDNYVKQLCDAHTADGATFDTAAYDTYIYVSRTDYVERENNQSPWGENWAREYAKQYFEEGNKGNCYNFAAVTEFVLKYFGYSDAEAQPCIVRLESGAWGDHGLVFVTNKVDGKRCIIDDALSANGWMLGIDDYDYDVRNIAQNATVKGNVDALDDDDNPTPIPPGELTEPATGANTANTANGATTATTDETAETNVGEQAYDGSDEEYYDDGSGTEEYYDDGSGTEEEYPAEEGEFAEEEA